jgi:hypothetical protein
MAYRINTAQRNRLAESGGSSFDGGTLEIRTGTQPASANDAASGTLLCTITLPSPAFAAPSGGVVAKSGTWAGTAGADGTAGYARFISSSGDRRMDGAVGAEVTLDNTSIQTGGTVTVTAATITQASGE